MWFNDQKVSKSRTFAVTRVGAVTVILIVLQILVEMCLFGAYKLMNSLLNGINHAGIIYTLIFN